MVYNQNKLVLTVGISASGKSTWANKQNKDEYVNINRDDIRASLFDDFSWGTYKFSKKNEEKVTKIQMEMVQHAFINNMHIIISDTNLNEKYRNQWKEYAAKIGYQFEIVEFPIDFDEAVKRDNQRENGVGQDVIYKQYQQWLKYIGRKTYTPNENLTKAMIVDIDGTIAKMVNRKPFDWDKVSQDAPREFIIDLIKTYNMWNDDISQIIFVSGRDSVCRLDTLTWIAKHFNNMSQHKINLYMRVEGDCRKDSIVKEELFWKIANKYNIVAVFDDRPQVVKMWHELGIENVICVGNPYINF